VLDAAERNRVARAWSDIVGGLLAWRFVLALSRSDIRGRYRGSVLGPLWLTLTTAVSIAAFGLLYGKIFNIPWQEHVLHVGVSLIIWAWFSQAVSESCNTMLGGESMIRQIPLPMSVHILRTAMRNLIVGGHHAILLPALFLICGFVPHAKGVPLALLGVLVVLINTISLATQLGFLGARFRDLAPIVANVMQLMFFLSPILWQASALGDKADLLVFNPVFIMIEIIRTPLLTGTLNPAQWIAAGVFTFLGAGLAGAMFIRFRDRVAFWV
jgi:lipopolysaccharide transport system permease protein